MRRKVWTEGSVNRLKRELESRHIALESAMQMISSHNPVGVYLEGSKLRMAVDDYNVVLKEIKRLV